MSEQDLEQGDNSTEAGEALDTPAPAGTVASHPERLAQPFLVAPTTEKDFNTLSLDLVAVACLQLPDILFEFDSSFPNPGVAAMLKEVPPLRQKHKNAKGQLPPLSVFGHADPSGDDDYNKQLSGRRAMAIYGVLTRDMKLWDFLFDNPHGGDDWKSKNVVSTMRSALGEPAGKPRQELVQAYMKLLSPEPLQKSDFIGQGGDAKGKADFQGCSEFNPLLLLSTKENETLPKAKRNEENVSNRRVIIFMFRAGMKVNPKLWPCPTALAGTADCFKRFFGPPKTGNERRKPGPERREFAKTLDTFACRFYDRVARLSPCELPLPPVVLEVNPLIFFESGEPVATASGPTAAKASASALAPSVGAPQITVARGVVIVKKPHTNPKRLPVVLKTDTAFGGTGEFTAAPADTILFFRTATGGAAIKFDKKQNVFGGKSLTAGVTLFAEARIVSGSIDDVTLTLNLTGGGKVIKNNPRTEKMTAVELFLDIHKIRTAAGADPAALSETDKVNPGRAIHVQNTAKKRRRALLIVKQVKPGFPPKFTNKLELTVNNAKVTLFSNETPPAGGAADPVKATPLEIDHTKLPLKFFVEGTSVSDKVRDTTLKLGIKGMEPDGDHVVVTVIEAKLDIFKSREKAGKARDPVPAADKIKLGRFIHIQDTGATKRKHRALMIVRPVKPAGFIGKLVLTPIESLATPPAAAKLRLFAKETPDAAAALGMPLEIDHSATFPAEGERRFVEGAVLSTALIDSGFRLGVKDVEEECDRVAVTVFQVEKVEVKLARTRCRRAAAGDMPAKVITTDTKTFDATTPAVVRQCGDLLMEATVKPAAVKLSWDVERAADDDKSLKGLPTHADNGAPNKRKVTADGTGSFHVFAFVDANGNGKHSDDEDGVTVNLDMVEIKVPAGAANNKIFRNPAYSNARSTAGALVVDSGLSQGTFAIAPSIGGAYGDAEFVRHLIGFKVRVNLIGGGANKRRGVSKLTLGYNQTTTADSVVGTYADGRTERETLFVMPIPPANLGPGGQVVSGAGLATLAFPVRDTRGASNSGTGPFIISSSDANPADKKNLASGGEQRVVRMIDPPAIAIDMTHPVTGSALASIAGSNNFAVFLVAFSSDFNENYTEIASATWSTTYGTFTAAGGWTIAGAALTAAAAMTVSASAQPGDSSNMERCPPNFVDVIPMDAR
jgi:hypothetical protein